MKKFLPMIPMILFIYSVPVTLLSFMATADFKLLFISPGLLLISIVCSVLVFSFTVTGEWDPKVTARNVMIAKLIQIPAYVTIFALGVLFFIMPLTWGFILLFIVLDCISVGLTGFAALSCTLSGCQTQKLKPWEATLFGIGNFLFVVDVAAVIVNYVLIRKRSKALLCA